MKHAFFVLYVFVEATVKEDGVNMPKLLQSVYIS